jgi:hypothetical protein
MNARHLTFIAAVAAAGCSSGSALPTEADVLEVQMLPAAGNCKVGDVELPCSDLPAHLISTLNVSLESPVSIQWEGGVMPDRDRLSALAQALKRAGFKTVGFVSIARYDSASSRRDR